jgi:hypothetical protein
MAPWLADAIYALFCLVLGGIFGGMASLIVFGRLRLTLPTLRCSECDAPRPLFPRVSSWSQLFRNGWTCPGCGCELDRTGRKLPSA